VTSFIGRSPPAHHGILIDGFRSVVDKNGLGWAVLDSKSEQLVTSAIATSINRKLGRRIAHTEFPPRIDLAILTSPILHRPQQRLDTTSCSIEIGYEAKIGQCFDFAPQQNTAPKYLGADLDADMEGMRLGRGAGLFFISEAHEANRHLKYFRGHTTNIQAVAAVLAKHVTRGTLVAHEVMDCGIADGTEVKIHMLVFDPKLP
jgi:hypothetical protein